ncbi:MAG: helix-turn-helix domain-containing protein [Clostridia bacterium]|nr:MAG: helix-turn-helix domain-containing protein [Clostridia bacterium]
MPQAKRNVTIQLTIGSRTAYVNGQARELIIPPRPQSGRALLPLRFIGEAAGASLDRNNVLQIWPLYGKVLPEVISLEILTVEEAAKMVRMSEYTLRKYAKKGRIPAHKVGGQWRFSREELLDWFRATGSGARDFFPGDGHRKVEFDEPITPEEAEVSETAWQAYLAGLDKGEPLEKVRRELLEERRG